MSKSFQEILERIRILDRDVAELNRLKSSLPADRTFSPTLQLSFDKQINALIKERMAILELPVPNAPEWIFPDDSKLTTGIPSVLLTKKGIKGDLSLPEPNEQDVMNFLRDIPKTEIHLHLEACVNKATLKYLYAKNNNPVTDEEIEAKFNFKDLNGFIQVFFFVQGAVKEPEDLSYMISSLAEYLKSNNIIYCETFFAPSKFIQNGLDFDAMIEVLVTRIREVEVKEGISIRLLIDVSRSFGPENAMNNLKRVLNIKHKEVIGIGLGGAELMGPAKDYGEVFKIARESGLRTVAHSGEDDGPWAIWDALEICKAERIGHGLSAIQDPKLIDYFKEKQIPIEICVTSNVFTGKYVRKEENHPVRYYYEKGLNLCINTDDPEIFNVNLTYEYFKLHRFLGFSIPEILDLVKKSVYCTFHPNKESLWRQMEEKIEKIKEDYNLPAYNLLS